MNKGLWIRAVAFVCCSWVCDFGVALVVDPEKLMWLRSDGNVWYRIYLATNVAAAWILADVIGGAFEGREVEP